jgi:Holliday junction DNA helicase RuvA
MIGFLRGVLVAKAPPSLLLEVRGVGYEVEAPMSTFYDLPAVGEEVRLFTHFVVREDAHTLYGFSCESDRALFRSLVRVNGVGARLALTILSGISAESFHRCVQNHDMAALVRLPGIGKKTAERLIVEMRDRLPNVTVGAGRGLAPSLAADDPVHEAATALIALGYKPQDASRMAREAGGDDRSSEEIIRLALQAAGRA